MLLVLSYLLILRPRTVSFFQKYYILTEIIIIFEEICINDTGQNEKVIKIIILKKKFSRKHFQKLWLLLEKVRYILM